VRGDNDPDVPGFRLERGDHACALIIGRHQRDEVMRPFVGEGLRDGDKCICVVDSAHPATTMEGSGVDVEACVADRRLDLWRSADVYCSGRRLCTQEMLDRWSGVFDEALGDAGSFGCVRVAAEVSPTAVRDGADLGELFRYELAYDRAFSGYPLLTMCVYDLGRFGGGVLMTLLRTHPKLLLGGIVIENPRYVRSP
jgi:hypothetical protein